MHPLLLFCYLASVHSLKILIMNPYFGLSHMRFAGNLADVLLEEGHDVVEMRPILDHSLQAVHISNTQKIKTIEISPEAEVLFQQMNQADGLFAQVWNVEPSPIAMVDMFKQLSKLFSLQCDHVVSNTTLLEQLRQEKFDIGIEEGFNFCGFGIFEAIGLKTTVATSSTIMYDHQAHLFGIPVLPSFIPGGMAPFGDSMTFVERFSNALRILMGRQAFSAIVDAQTAVFQKRFGKHFPSTEELFSRCSLLVTNSNPLLDFPHPNLHNVIEVGGIGVKKEVVLHKKWEGILGKRKHTVLVSFGSVARSSDMPPQMKASIVETARRMSDVLFIWKYEAKDLTDVPDNLVLSKWLPQGGILATGRVSLFITHGGLASMIESAYNGVPTIVVPLFADQPRNAAMMNKHGLSIIASRAVLSNSDLLEKNINDVLNNTTFAEKARLVSQQLRNAAFSPREVFLRNIEFVGRFGRLRTREPYSRQLSFVQYFMIDIVAFLATVLVIVILFLAYLIRAFVLHISIRLHKTKVA